MLLDNAIMDLLYSAVNIFIIISAQYNYHDPHPERRSATGENSQFLSTRVSWAYSARDASKNFQMVAPLTPPGSNNTVRQE